MVASRRNSGKLWKASHDGLYASPNLGALRSNVSRTQASHDVCPVAGSRVSSRRKHAGKEEGSLLVFFFWFKRRLHRKQSFTRKQVVLNSDATFRPRLSNNKRQPLPRRNAHALPNWNLYLLWSVFPKDLL